MPASSAAPRPSTLLTLTSMLAGSGAALGVPLLAFVYGQQAGLNTQAVGDIAGMGVIGGSVLALSGMWYGIAGPARAERKAERAQRGTTSAPAEAGPEKAASFERLVQEQVQSQEDEGEDCSPRAHFFARRAGGLRDAARTARGHVAKAGERVRRAGGCLRSMGHTARRKWNAAKAA